MRISRANYNSAKLVILSCTVFLCVFMLGSAGPVWGQVRVTNGPLVGAVTPESARILVRTNGQAVVHFDLDTDSTFANPIVSSSALAEPDSDFFVIVKVSGLTPNAQYYYRAVIDNVPQMDIHSFMTFPPAGTETVFTFAFGSCQQAAGDPESYTGRVFPLIARDEPRFFLQLGDWTYPDTTDSPDNLDYFNLDYGRVQANYESKYDPSYPMNELFEVAPIDYVYDDHDYSNENSDITFPGRENSIRGYKAMFPHYPLVNPQNGLWHRFTFGNADFFMLDTRTQRHQNQLAFQQDSAGKLIFQPGPEHYILQGDSDITGELQMDWLIRELQESTATWKFVCTSVPFNPSHRAPLELALFLQGGPFDPIRIPGLTVTPAELAITISDNWAGFPHSIQRLVKAVNESNLENVIVLSGDSHTAAIDDGANSLFPEIMAGGLDRTNSMIVAVAELLGMRLWNRGGQTLETRNFNNHYGRVTVFRSDSVRMELVDEFGELIASYTQLSRHVVSKVGLSYAIEFSNLSLQGIQGLDFGEVDVGSPSTLSILFVSTGAEPVVVSKVSSSSSEFIALQQSFVIPPGERHDVEILFQPQAVGDFQATLTIESNDPESPFVIHVQGKGSQPTGVEEAVTEAPSQFKLEQNYPNPFNATTRVAYELAQESEVTLRIFNLNGQVVRTFKFLKQTPGRYFIDWNGLNYGGRQVASGVYIVHLEASPAAGGKKFLQTKQMVLLR
ncbi:MAG: alkaline phosphatase D family protein [bacterium]